MARVVCGCFMGMYSYLQNSKTKKKTVNEYLSIDIRKIRSIFRFPSAKMTMTWTVTSNRNTQIFTSTLSLSGQRVYVTNPFDGDEIGITILLRKAYFGGWRKFFYCPWCSRVCEILYFSPDDYGCRVCLELTYVSVQEAHKLDGPLRRLFPGIPLRMAKKIHRELMRTRFM
jgi:hypothetical protein